MAKPTRAVTRVFVLSAVALLGRVALLPGCSSDSSTTSTTVSGTGATSGAGGVGDTGGSGGNTGASGSTGAGGTAGTGGEPAGGTAGTGGEPSGGTAGTGAEPVAGTAGTGVAGTPGGSGAGGYAGTTGASGNGGAGGFAGVGGVAGSAGACAGTVPVGPYQWVGNEPIAADTCASGTGVSLAINVPECFAISSLSVGLNATHTFRGDVQVTLTSPTGTAVSLLPVDALRANANIDVTFADGGLDPASDTVDHVTTPPPYENVWAPEEPLATFDGEDAHGNWSLYVCDQAAMDSGTVGSWELFFNPGGAGGAGGMGGAGGVGGVGGVSGASGTSGAAPMAANACMTDQECANSDPNNPCCFTTYCGPPPCL